MGKERFSVKTTTTTTTTYLDLAHLGGHARHIVPHLGPSQSVIADEKITCWGKEPSRSSLLSVLFVTFFFCLFSRFFRSSLFGVFPATKYEYEYFTAVCMHAFGVPPCIDKKLAFHLFLFVVFFFRFFNVTSDERGQG